MIKIASLFLAGCILMLTQSCFLLQTTVSVDEPENRIYQNNNILSVDLKDFEGKYTFEQNPLVKTIVVSSVKDKLFAEDNNQTKYELVQDKDNKDVFLVPDVQGQLTFIRNEKKIISGAKLSIQGDEYTAKKDN
jgi:hypothetical protein